MPHVTADGNYITAHAEQRMAERHITDWQVDSAIANGWTRAGTEPGTTEHHNQYGRGLCLFVVTGNDGAVITTYRHLARRH